MCVLLPVLCCFMRAVALAAGRRRRRRRRFLSKLLCCCFLAFPTASPLPSPLISINLDLLYIPLPLEYPFELKKKAGKAGKVRNAQVFALFPFLLSLPHQHI